MFGRILFEIVVITAMVITTMGIGCGKKGVVIWADDYLCGDLAVLSPDWWYDYTCNMDHFRERNICTCQTQQKKKKKNTDTCPPIFDYSSTYVPMVWGFYSNTNFLCWADNNPKYVLGINEPNHQQQANIYPAVAAAYWPNFEGNATGRAVIGPSAAPCGANCIGNTTQWLDQFVENCENCRIDFFATHTYWCNANKVMDFLEMLYRRYRKLIWLTEFACVHNDANEVLKFMKEILPRLDRAFFVYRYAWFSNRIKTDDGWVKSSASLFEPDSSQPTSLGLYYGAHVSR